MAERRDDEELRKFSNLYNAVRGGNLDEVKVILESLPPDALNCKIPDKGKTALHTAVTHAHEHIVEALVMQMSNKGLTMYDSDGHTALTMAVLLGKWRMVECMLRKYFDLISIRHSEGKNLPVVMAIDFGHIEMARQLYYLTPNRDLIPQDNDEEIQDPNGATLFTRAIYTGTFGMRIPFAPPTSETRLNVSNGDQRQSNQEDQNIISVMSRSCAVGVLNFFGITQLYELKKIHVQYNELLSHMCKVISESKTQQLKDGRVYSAINQATKNGSFEFVSKMLETDLRFIWYRDEDRRNIFMLAVLHRQEKIFSILYSGDMMMSYNAMKCLQDVDGNNILHMAGMLEHSTRVNQIPGAALQMQRELQWFKEVERIVHPKDKETTNKYGLTPRQLFTKNHENMMEKGEKWMKDTARSCTVVGALIVTIMFAVAFTIPGGNNQDTGLPIFLNKKSFRVFMICDALSFFLSSTSVLMFLGILTSRYTEDDFLEYLPRQMIIGLSTLFCSIATMMITFASALLIILHEQSRIAIPLICLGGVPVTIFLWIQLPILKDMIISTYGPSIFGQRVRLREQATCEGEARDRELRAGACETEKSLRQASCKGEAREVAVS